MKNLVTIVLLMLVGVTVNARPLTELEIQVIKTQVCTNNDLSILRSLDINDTTTQPQPQPQPEPQCKYDFVYCRTADPKTLNRIYGPRIYVNSCNIKGALRTAIDSLWGQCGGILSDRCIKPADCYGIDRSGYESSLGSYTFPDEAGN